MVIPVPRWPNDPTYCIETGRDSSYGCTESDIDRPPSPPWPPHDVKTGLAANLKDGLNGAHSVLVE